MKTLAFAFVLAIVLPSFSFASDSHMKFVAVKHTGDNHMFLYRCYENGKIVEVEQKYNPNTKFEEVRFIVNGDGSEWITNGLNLDVWNEFSQNACQESELEYVAADRRF